MNRKNVRDFNTIRIVASKMYIYGFYTREELIENGVVSSPRIYDDIVRQLRDLYYYDEDGEEAFLKEDKEKRGKYKCYTFRRDYFKNQNEFLTALYGLHAIKDSGIANTVVCMTMTSSETGTGIEKIAEFFLDEDGTDYTPTIRRRLQSLEAAGYLFRMRKSGWFKSEQYSLTDEELREVYYLACFFAGAAYPRVPAVFLKKALLRQIHVRGLDEPKELFLFRDNTCGNVLDEEIVYTLLHGCRRRNLMQITYAKSGKEEMLYPVFLKIDRRYGRWYFFALDEQRRQRVIRVSNIRKAVILNETLDYEAGEIEKLFSYYNVSGRVVAEPILVEAELHFDAVGMRNQFEREIPFGGIEQRGDKEFFSAKINDPLELKPFLRCYGAHLSVVDSPFHRLGKEIKEEYERMLLKYESI